MGPIKALGVYPENFVTEPQTDIQTLRLLYIDQHICTLTYTILHCIYISRSKVCSYHQRQQNHTKAAIVCFMMLWNALCAFRRNLGAAGSDGDFVRKIREKYSSISNSLNSVVRPSVRLSARPPDSPFGPEGPFSPLQELELSSL